MFSFHIKIEIGYIFFVFIVFMKKCLQINYIGHVIHFNILNFNILMQELENLKVYPVEVIAGQLYMGDQQQGADLEILKNLKIKAVVNISESNNQEE